MGDEQEAVIGSSSPSWASVGEMEERLNRGDDEKLEEELNKWLIVELLELLVAPSSQDRDQASEVSTLLVEKLKSKPRVKIRLWHTLLERANAPGSSLQQRNLALTLLDMAFRRGGTDKKARERIVEEIAGLSEAEKLLCPSIERRRQPQVLSSKSAPTAKSTQWSAYSAEAAERYKKDIVSCPEPKRLSEDELAALAAQSATLDELANSSALHNNISSKGKNSYYHAHQRKGPAAPFAGPTLVAGGKAAAAGKTEREAVSSGSASGSGSVVSISKYGFLDEAAKAKLYVDFEGASEVPKEQVAFEWTPTSFVLTVNVNKGGKPESVQHVLRVEQLYGEIAGASVKQKRDKFVLILKKVKQVGWLSLKVRQKKIRKYDFVDESEPGKASVHIDFAGAKALPKEQVAFEWTPTSFMLTVNVNKGGKPESVQHVLRVEQLYGEIAGASVKQQEDYMVVQLDKKLEGTTAAEWAALKAPKGKGRGAGAREGTEPALSGSGPPPD
eukprot:g1889.t1